MLGEPVALDTPDVYSADRNLLAGRRYREKSPAMGSAPCIAGDDLVAGENAVLDRDTKIRKGLASALQPAMLRIGLGEQCLERELTHWPAPGKSNCRRRSCIRKRPNSRAASAVAELDRLASCSNGFLRSSTGFGSVFVFIAGHRFGCRPSLWVMSYRYQVEPRSAAHFPV